MKQMSAALLFGVFLFVGLFGLPLLLSHDGHHIGCPLQVAGEVMCESTVIEHFSIWQAMFASVVALVALLAGAVLLVIGRLDAALIAHERLRLRFAHAIPARPTLMQELYSRGIHNRKEPSLFS